MIRPALTAEDWDDQTELGGPPEFLAEERITDPHYMAAMCLHEQEFGFTRADVRFLRSRSFIGSPQIGDLADRIEALLPPESLRSDG